MTCSLNPAFKWTLITIEDPEFLPGKNIVNIIQLISKVVCFKFVILDYIYGAANNGLIPFLQEKRNKILKIEDVFQEISKVIQFDWGDFFLFKEYPEQWNNSKGEQYSYVIAQTDTTIRAVDDQYIYVYTPYEEILNLIKKNYKIESVKIDMLQNLDYPE
ncbi:MAG: hypothetical protein JSR85_09030 [Proteobacteria bacterium]|nr:hypothetical protein [Pseudomonadota bacterium]